MVRIPLHKVIRRLALPLSALLHRLREVALGRQQVAHRSAHKQVLALHIRVQKPAAHRPHQGALH